MKKYFFVLIFSLFVLNGCGKVEKLPPVSDLPTHPTTNVLQDVQEVTETNEGREEPTSTIAQLNTAQDTIPYVNKKYNFSLYYPSNWKVEQSENLSTSYGEIFEDGYYFFLSDTSTLRPHADIPGLNIAITEKNFEYIVKMTEDVERLPNGDTISKVNNIQNITLDNVQIKMGDYGTAIGLAESFYFIPLPHQNKSLWITYRSFETSTIESVEKIISSLKLN